MAIKKAIELALSKGPIPRKYFEALCEDPREAEERAFAENTARKEAAFAAKYGFR